MRKLIYVGILILIILWLVKIAHADGPKNKAEALAAQGVVSVWVAPGSVMCTTPKGNLPKVTQGAIVAGHYAVASARAFPAAGNFAKDPRVCLYDGQKGLAGRLVFVEYQQPEYSRDAIPGMVLIRFEDGLNVGIVPMTDQPDRPSPFDRDGAEIVGKFLHDYFASWGKNVPDKPEF
jgi:hypothetical protein